MQKMVFRKVGVIGAGVMGSGIAAHMANCGLDVLLLDIAQPSLDKTLKAKPAAFYHPSLALRVETGALDARINDLAKCDLVIEAVFERIDVKQQLLTKLEPVLAAHTVVASNTSGLRIDRMLEGRSSAFKKRFLVMHFFNPVRYMKLLELVAGTDTDPNILAAVRAFGEDVLGKGIVVGKDTPNFIGNRIGTHAMMVGIHEMLASGLAPEDIDAITGEPMGHPKSASFRTGDLVGLDTFVHVADNCYESLTTDEEREVFKMPPYIQAMVEKKLLGDKTKAGFYKKEGKDILTFDPQSQSYRPRGGDGAIRKAMKALGEEEDVRARLRKLASDTGKAGAFAWKVLSRSLAYTARRVGEISDDIASIDDAMKWGYNWELGPFETWDALGFAKTVERMEADGIALPDTIKKMKASGATSFYKENEVFDLAKGKYVARARDPRTASFAILKRGNAPVLTNAGADAWDLGDGVLGLTFKTKANSIDADVITMIGQAVDRAERDFRAMILSNTGEFFCVGANLFAVVGAAMQKEWDGLRQMVAAYQGATQRMKYATVPVVVAPYGMTLGGGLELCFGGGAVQAAAETYSGLVEVGVGLIPGGAGTMNMLWRSLESVPDGTTVNVYEHVTQTFKNIALARVATSAEEAKRFGYFRAQDGVTIDKARQVQDAKARAIGLAESGWHPPSPRAWVLPGENGIATLTMMVRTLVQSGHASEHDAKIATKLAEVLCGGRGGAAHEVTEDHILELEREAFVSLCGEPKSIERMQFMLMNQKPLRN